MLSITESLLGYMRAGTAGAIGFGAGRASVDYDRGRMRDARSIYDSQRGIDPRQTYSDVNDGVIRDYIRRHSATIPVVGMIPALMAYHRRRKAEKAMGL